VSLKVSVGLAALTSHIGFFAAFPQKGSSNSQWQFPRAEGIPQWIVHLLRSIWDSFQRLQLLA